MAKLILSLVALVLVTSSSYFSFSEATHIFGREEPANLRVRRMVRRLLYDLSLEICDLMELKVCDRFLDYSTITAVTYREQKLHDGDTSNYYIVKVKYAPLSVYFHAKILYRVNGRPELRSVKGPMQRTSHIEWFDYGSWA